MNLLDRNKTDLTHIVTSAVMDWLDGKGFKPVETEVPIEEGWVADLAAAIYPTFTELQQLKIIPRRPPWKSDQAIKIAWDQRATEAQRMMVALVEVKTSRGDFLSDLKWKKAIPTDLAYLAYPAGLIAPSEWPQSWGILEHWGQTGTIRCRRAAGVFNVPAEQQRDLVYSIAMRRDNHTRYARLREIRQRERIRQNEDRTIRRCNDAVKAALAIARGLHESVEGVLEWYGIRNVPDWIKRDMEMLWNASPKVPIG